MNSKAAGQTGNQIATVTDGPTIATAEGVVIAETRRVDLTTTADTSSTDTTGGKTVTTSSAAQVEHIDPASIQIEDNVREAVDLPREFIASIKQHGVLQPVLATRDSEGVVRVRDGQRRTLAAREAGLAAIPAYVVDAGAETRTRLVQQIVANEQRDGLTARDKARGFHALALEGMNVAAITKATDTKRQHVQTHVTVAASERASAALEQGITLEAAAALAEFDGDEDAQNEILVALGRGQEGEWVAERIREWKRARPPSRPPPLPCARGPGSGSKCNGRWWPPDRGSARRCSRQAII